MGNLSNKLESLFRDYLIRKEKESRVPVYNTHSYPYCTGGGYRPHNSWMNDTNSEFDGVIYFYEWSDTDRAPQLFIF